jgi:hypothetical protein
MNSKSIGEIRSRNSNKREFVQVARLLDYIDIPTQEMILDWHKTGVTKRQMTNNLIELGIPSPPMKCPWGDSCFRAVINKYKKEEAKDV